MLCERVAKWYVKKPKILGISRRPGARNFPIIKIDRIKTAKRAPPTPAPFTDPASSAEPPKVPTYFPVRQKARLKNLDILLGLKNEEARRRCTYLSHTNTPIPWMPRKNKAVRNGLPKNDHSTGDIMTKCKDVRTKHGEALSEGTIGPTYHRK
jgi:hypothetical protein